MRLEDLRDAVKRIRWALKQSEQAHPAFRESMDDLGEYLIQMHNRVERIAADVAKLKHGRGFDEG